MGKPLPNSAPNWKYKVSWWGANLWWSEMEPNSSRIWKLPMHFKWEKPYQIRHRIEKSWTMRINLISRSRVDNSYIRGGAPLDYSNFSIFLYFHADFSDFWEFLYFHAHFLDLGPPSIAQKWSPLLSMITLCGYVEQAVDKYKDKCKLPLLNSVSKTLWW